MIFEITAIVFVIMVAILVIVAPDEDEEFYPDNEI